MSRRVSTPGGRQRVLIRAHIGDDFHIRDARWLTGGASKLQMAFTLEWTPPGAARQHSAMVLRMQPAESLVESSRRREYEVLAAMQGIVPVPPVYWVDADGDHLPYPAIIYGFAPGVTKPRDATSQATGMGTRLAAHWRDSARPAVRLRHRARAWRATSMARVCRVSICLRPAPPR